MDKTNKETTNDRNERERRAIAAARRENKMISYIDRDGIEVTVTPSGDTFYNASDWW